MDISKEWIQSTKEMKTGSQLNKTNLIVATKLPQFQQTAFLAYSRRIKLCTVVVKQRNSRCNKQLSPPTQNSIKHKTEI